jgi:hypothetical protein
MSTGRADESDRVNRPASVIGTKQTSGHVHLLVANGRKADIALASAEV